MASIFEYPGYPDSCPILRNPAPTIEGGPEGRQGQLTFLIPLNDLLTFINFISGNIETVTLSSGSTLERIIPLVHPWDSSMYAMTFSAEAFGPSGGSGADILSPMFGFYRVRVQFATLPYGTGGDQPYYSISTDIAAAHETIPGGALVFSDGTRISGDYGLAVPITSLSLTTYLSPSPISYAVSALTGKVNSVAFDDYPIGTLLFCGVKSQLDVGASSRTFVKNFTLKFREKPWNNVMRKDGTWESPTLIGTGLTRFASADMNILKTT